MYNYYNNNYTFIKGDNMEIKVNYLGVGVIINKNTNKIIITNNANSEVLFNMAFKAILNSININVNDYEIINNS